MTVRLYEVGGSIRNEALMIPVNDRDFVGVCGTGWGGLVRWADENLDKIFLTTPEFFTIRGIKGKEIFDIVLARKDGAYSDGRHPDKVEPGTLEDDLARRDFTMNAIARCVDTGKLFDPFNGFGDIEKGIIRCVGDNGDGVNACNRIREDVLRIVRAMRFSVTLPGMFIDNYLARILIDDELMTTGESISRLLANVSRERIREELLKMFAHDTLAAARFLFAFDRVAPAIRQALFGNENDIWLKPTMEKR
jgi:tRNA nucleotidyltransferase (CCA-adding enzyme)